MVKLFFKKACGLQGRALRSFPAMAQPERNQGTGRTPPKGVAKALLEKAAAAAKERGFQGLYTQGQDNNLGACLFYVKQGFVIGGLDTKVYQGTPQEGKKDILFYWDF